MVERHSGEFVKHKNFPVLFLIAVSALAFAAGPIYGQEFFGDGGEVSAMSGVVFPGIGPRPIVSGSAGADVTRYVMVLGETAMIPISNQTLLPAHAFNVRGSNLFDFNIALQVRIPIKTMGTVRHAWNGGADEPVHGGVSEPDRKCRVCGRTALEVWPGMGSGLPVLRQGKLGSPGGVPIHLIDA